MYVHITVVCHTLHALLSLSAISHVTDRARCPSLSMYFYL